MPHITVESGKLSEEQKRALVERLTAVSSEVMQIPAEFYTVTLHEIDDVNYGIGGKCIDVVKREYMERAGQ